MKTYLVGGAVRDKLLNLPIHERDWVVVNATAKELLELGYTQVGKDFPVFLHPITKEEYALARTERKSGSGYTGFICDFNRSITLEQDLIRRDLTINAIALDQDNNQIIDPYHGVDDLNNRILRHVSPAFSEDPLRVLRVARFAARFHHLGFQIALATDELMCQIVQNGEMQALTPERVWKETEKALLTDDPQIYFQVLKKCGALTILFPEIDNLFGVPAPAKWHPEIDTGIHSLMTLKQAAQLTKDPIIRFAALCHDVGKALTPKEILPHHPEHDLAGIPIVNQLCDRFKIPNSYRHTAQMICQYHEKVHHVDKMSSIELIELLDGINVWRTPHHLKQLIICSIADFKGRKNFENKSYPQAQILKQGYLIANTVTAQQVIQDGYRGQAIKDALSSYRAIALDKWKKHQI